MRRALSSLVNRCAFHGAYVPMRTFANRADHCRQHGKSASSPLFSRDGAPAAASGTGTQLLARRYFCRLCLIRTVYPAGGIWRQVLSEGKPRRGYRRRKNFWRWISVIVLPAGGFWPRAGRWEKYWRQVRWWLSKRPARCVDFARTQVKRRAGQRANEIMRSAHLDCARWLLLTIPTVAKPVVSPQR
ncbi:hypothetical protein KCP74_24155 [Salmonella enterica subsp. enterica]|nr:hypothetical protein KCP74_24155 [Salmonella enterica subsp. enterica]